MTISERSIRRPVLVTFVYVILIALSFIAVSSIDISLNPDVDNPILSLMVSCTGVGPEEIEEQVAKLLEDDLSSLEDLESITTQCSNGECLVVLEFKYGTDLDEREDDVTSKINMLTRRLPSWADTPTILDFDAIMSSSVMTLVLSGNKSMEELYNIAENTVEPLLERISGVSNVNIIGGTEIEYVVSVSRNRMEAYGISIAQIASVLKNQNEKTSLGSITKNDKNTEIQINGQFSNPDDILETVITTIDGVAIKVKDVATLETEDADNFRESYYNGNEVVSLMITNSSESNATSVAKAIKAAIPSIEEKLDDGVELSIRNDSTEMISSTMSEVYKSAFEGVLLAALIIFIFLRNFKSTFIITLSMPISILLTLAVLSMMDISVNSMSMAGLILGIGMIVDASIIILENTYSFRAKGEKPAIAAIKGSKDMFASILASTLTTICVFIPFIIEKYSLGSIGLMFQDLIITVCVALACSLLVSVTLVPALCGSILRINTRTQKPIKNRVIRFIDDGLAALEDGMRKGYRKVLSYFLKYRLLLIVLLVLLLLYAFTFISGIKMSMTPKMTTDDEVSLSLSLPSGTINDITRERLFSMNDRIAETLPEGSYTSVSIDVGSSNTGSITITLPDITEQKYGAEEIKNMIRPLLSSTPDETWSFGSGRGMMGDDIDIEIHSSDEEMAEVVSKEIVALLEKNVPIIQDISSDFEDGDPKIEVVIDKKMADDLGISMSDVSSFLSGAIGGITATEISTFKSDTTYDLNVEIRDEDKSNLASLGALTIETKEGRVRLDSFVTFSEGKSPKTITREEKTRVNHITASAKDGYSASEAQDMVDKVLEEYLILPDGVTLKQSGQMVEFQSYTSTIVFIVVLALLLVYSVMAAQFESLINPLIIFATIPLLLIGVIFIHITTNTDFTLFSIIGVVALIGVVVNNGIVLVDDIDRRVRRKTPVKTACLDAAVDRLRPILMTTLTTVLGMIPLAFFPGEGSEMMQPIALTFVGGLVTGAFLTLLLSPVLYSILNKNREKKFNDPNTLQNQLLEYDSRNRGNVRYRRK